jgi:hypothetical protein
MATTDGTHICHFMLEQNAKGYFTGNFICTYCRHKVAQSQWFDTLARNTREASHGSSRTPSRPNQ